MPRQNRPITHAPTEERSSVGHGSEYHGKHREEDDALPGRGSTKGGLNRSGGEDGEGRSTSGRGRAKGSDKGPGHKERTRS